MSKRVLVVDDDMMCLKSVQRFLAEEHFDVLGALSGMQAVNIIEDMKVDLLLLDIEMPEMNGFATLEYIRKLPNGKTLPTIFFTGRTDRETVKQCSMAGGVGYIAKPVEKNILHEKLREVFSDNPDISGEKTIVIVDDDIEFLKRAKLELQKDYKVIIINSAKSAAAYLNEHQADLILWKDALTEEERAGILNGPAKDTPRILLSKQADSPQVAESTTQLFLPVETDVLVQIIKGLLA